MVLKIFRNLHIGFIHLLYLFIIFCVCEQYITGTANIDCLKGPNLYLISFVYEKYQHK